MDLAMGLAKAQFTAQNSTQLKIAVELFSEIQAGAATGHQQTQQHAYAMR